MVNVKLPVTAVAYIRPVFLFLTESLTKDTFIIKSGIKS